MFYELRRTDRKLSSKETEEILSSCSYGILSTIEENGYPYGVPVNYIFLNGNIYFHCAAHEGHKLDNIRNSNKVCFTVVGNHTIVPSKLTTAYESAVVFGIAEVINEDEKRDILLHLLSTFSPEFMEIGLEAINKSFDKVDIVKIIPENITGKANRQ